MLATTAFHTSSISNMPLYFFPPLLLFLYLFPGFSLLIPFPYGIPPLNLSPPLIIFLTLASLRSPHLPTPCPTYFSTPPFFLHPLLLFCPLLAPSLPLPPTPSPLPAPPPTSSLITSYKFLPLSFIFSTPSSPPPLRLTLPPTPHSPFINSSSSSFSPFFFSHLSSYPFSHLSSRSLFLPFFYFHPLLLSQSWSLYLIHQSSKPVMI